MNTWTEMINGPLRSEMLQLEILFQKMMESIPLITFSAIAMFFVLLGLLAALDCIFLRDKDSQMTNKESQTEEQYPNSSRDKYSQQATRYLLNDTNAAA